MIVDLEKFRKDKESKGKKNRGFSKHASKEERLKALSDLIDQGDYKVPVEKVSEAILKSTEASESDKEN